VVKKPLSKNSVVRLTPTERKMLEACLNEKKMVFS